MTDWILWYIVASVLGWLAFPIAYRLLPALRDRGYAASRTLGLLIWGFLFWLFATLGILPFNMGGILFAAALLSGLSLWALLGIRPKELLIWLDGQKSVLVMTELLFLVAFAGWAVVRAANPEAIGTEKPMELAFINAILRSPTFPPHDPWLSGFGISYYYFGYVLTAMLAKISSTPGSVAFNLGISLVFALSAIGAYGLIVNLLNAASKRSGLKRPGYTFASLIGPLYVLIVSNLEGLLHVLHTRGFFWQRDASGALVSPFWRWLDLQDLSSSPQEPFSWIPTRFWWWWRASRVLQDYDLNGVPKEIIDEFPFFSYLLADLHPHVLAMPFAFLAITLALNMLFSPKMHPGQGLRFQLSRTWARRISYAAIPVGLLLIGLGLIRLQGLLVGAGFLLLLASGGLYWSSLQQPGEKGEDSIVTGESRLSFGIEVYPGFILLAGVALGGLAFLNTWDFPAYVFIFSTAFALNQYLVLGRSIRQSIIGFIKVGISVAACGVLLYLPFYLGFSSQAGGILPNLIYPTRGVHLWVMFAPLFVPILAYLIYQHTRIRDRKALISGFGTAVGIFALLWVFSLFLGLAISLIGGVGDMYLGSLGATNTPQLFSASFQRRFAAPGAWITLLSILGLLVSLLPYIEKMHHALKPKNSQSPAPGAPEAFQNFLSNNALELPGVFSLILILTGLLLVIAPEFIFLQDLFVWRMNTIFKFYFQTWLIWSIAAAFCVVTLFERLKRGWAVIFQVGIVLILLASLVYPAISVWSKTNGFRPVAWTLDSAEYFERHFPDEAAAVDWLKQAPDGILAEAVPATGGSYTEFARFATLTGLPSVLGWVGHENQWRGGSQAVGTRQSDLERLYCSRDWEEASQILDLYQIRYIIIGSLERATYTTKSAGCPVGLVESKFADNMEAVFEMGPVVIYEYTGTDQP